MLDQYSGGIGDIALPHMTKFAEESLLENKFTTNAILKNKNVEAFYEMLENAQVQNNSQYATESDSLTYKYLYGVSKEVGKLYGEKRDIQESDLSDKDKKRQTLEIQKEINEKVESALKTVYSLELDDTTAKFDDKEYYKDSSGSWNEIKDEDKIEGISTSTLADFKSKLSIANKSKNDTEGKDLTNKEKIQMLNNGTYTNAEKDKLYSEVINKNDDTYEGYKYLRGDLSGVEDYLNYKATTFESDKIDDGTVNGKSVTKGEGTKKSKITSYLSSSNFTPLERLYIYGSTDSYKLDKTQRAEFDKLLNEQDLTPEQKKKIYLQLNGVAETKDGGIAWK